MTLATIALKNAMRSKLRTALTVVGIAVAVLLFISLRTVVDAWTGAIDHAAQDRIASRHKVTFIMPLPRRYVDDIRDTPGVLDTSWMSWFGGKDPAHETEFFGTIAVDPESFLRVYEEILVPADQAAAWTQNRRGALVGDVLANKLGWEIGHRVTLVGTIYPGEWEFEIAGIYTAKARTVDRSTFWFHWDYLNESVPAPQQDQVGWIVSRIGDPARSAAISQRIDEMFDERDVQTLTMSEKALQQSFLGMFSAVLTAIDIVSVAILAIILLILGNTIAMVVRERTAEYGCLRAIGFRARHLAGFVFGEALTVGLAGGVLGLALALLFVNGMLGPALEANMGGFFPYFRVNPATAAVAVAIAAALALAAAALPAWRASKLDVVEALRTAE